MSGRQILLFVALFIMAVFGILFIFGRDQIGTQDLRQLGRFEDLNPSPSPLVSPIVSPSPSPSPEAENQFAADLSEVDESNEVGTATLIEIDDQVLVDLNMTNFPQGVPQPAHIHAGACPDVGDIIFPLNNVVNGKSRTILDTSLEYLRSLEPLAINVHKSVPESEIYVSCGDLVL